MRRDLCWFGCHMSPFGISFCIYRLLSLSAGKYSADRRTTIGDPSIHLSASERTVRKQPFTPAGLENGREELEQGSFAYTHDWVESIERGFDVG